MTSRSGSRRSLVGLRLGVLGLVGLLLGLAPPPPAQAAEGAGQPGPASASRHTTAVALADGRVLAAGGTGPEFLDAEATGWQPAPEDPLHLQPSSGVLLADGRVLFVGDARVSEYNPTPPTSTLFDPATSSWTATGELVAGPRVRRWSRCPTAGPCWSARRSTHRAPEQFDPSSRTWRSVARPRRTHAGGTPTVLANGEPVVELAAARGTFSCLAVQDNADGLSVRSDTPTRLSDSVLTGNTGTQGGYDARTGSVLQTPGVFWGQPGGPLPRQVSDRSKLVDIAPAAAVPACAGGHPVVPPTAPTDVQAARQDDGQVRLQWSAPTDDGGGPVTRYVVTSPDASTRSVPAEQTSLVLPGDPAAPVLSTSVRRTARRSDRPRAARPAGPAARTGRARGPAVRLRGRAGPGGRAR